MSMIYDDAIVVRFPKNIKEDVSQFAKRHGISIDDFIKEAVTNELQEWGVKFGIADNKHENLQL